MKKTILLCIAWLLQMPVASCFAQTEQSLFFMKNVYQSSYANVANLPNYRVSVTLPGLGGLGLGLVNSGFDLKSVSRFQNDTTFIDGNKLVNGLGKYNLVAFNLQYDLFALRFRSRRTFFSFNVSDRFFFRFSYPKSLMELLWYGNTRFLGQNLAMNNLGVSSTFYREYGVGISHEAGRFTYGGRIKLLQGFGNVSTSRSQATLFTAPTFDQLEVQSNLVVNTSGYDEKYYEDIDQDKVVSLLTDFSNKGFGLDASLGYQATDALKLHAGVNNLGRIRWTRFVKNYTSQGTVDFKGVELSAIAKDSVVDFDNYFDSVGRRFEFRESANAYSTGILANYFLSANYTFDPAFSLGGAVFMEYYFGFRPATTVAAQLALNRWLEMNLTWSTQYRKYDLFGAAFMVKPGPFQFFLAGDNLFGLFNPANVRSFNLRLGMNLVFGRIRAQDELPQPMEP
jgi:hypothetical protein